MKNVFMIIKEIGNMILSVVLFGILLTVLMLIIYCIPLNQKNFDKSVAIMQDEGDRPNVLERNKGTWENANGFEPGIVSTTNEIANFYRAAGTDGKSPLYNVIAMDSPEWGPYARYWHAYAAGIRLMLLFFDIREMRFLSIILQLLMIFLIMRKISEYEGKTASLLFFTSYVLMMPLAMATYSVYAFGFDFILISIFLMLMVIKKSGEDYPDTWFVCRAFCMIGCGMCAFDKLILGIISWALPIMIIVLLYGKKRKASSNIITVVNSGFAWLLGYCGLWIFKFIIATLYLKENVFATASSRIENWAEGGFGESPGRMFSLFRAYKHYTYKIFAIIIVAWIIYLSFRLIIYGLKKDSRIPAIFLASLGPLVWGFVLDEHIYYHHIMTYRQISVTIVGILFLMMIAGENKDCIREKGKLFKNSLILIFCTLLSFILVSFIKEEQSVSNNNYPGFYTYFNDSDPVMLIHIYPLYNQITELDMGIVSVSDKGSYRFSLLENGLIVDEYELSALEVMENPWLIMSVDWTFESEKEYMLKIEAVSTDFGSGLLVLNDDNGAMKDISGLAIAGIQAPTQPVFRIKYLRRLNLKDYIVFALSIHAFIFSMCLSIQSIMRQKEKYETNNTDSML